MSRNIRQKYPRAPAKTVKRRGSESSSLNLSDDDGYSGVEDISDSDDDDEEHVHAAEEDHIISHELRQGPSGSPRPKHNNLDSDADEADGEDEDDEEDGAELDDNDDTSDDDDEAVEEEDDDGASDENVSWDGILSDIDDSGTSDLAAGGYILDQDVANIKRHVRFTGVPDSDSDSTTTDTTKDIDGFFPDLFVEQNALDPAFRREIEYDPDDSSNSGGFWDFQSSHDQFAPDSDDDMGGAVLEEITPTATPRASQAPTEALTPTPVPTGEVQELDGYETDGDTTEDDIPDPPVRRKQVRRCQSAGMSSDSDTERPAQFKRGQPRLGRYNLDSSDKKPIAVVNPISRKMMIFTPQRLRRLDLSPESFNIDYFNNPDVIQSSPILSNSASLMMSAMFSSNTFGDFMNTQAVGPAEAFFPFTSDAITADDSDGTGMADDDEEDEEEKLLKLEDFITFHHESSEDEDDQDDENWDLDANTDLISSPIRPRTSRTSISAASATSDTSMMGAHPLLTHFDNNSDAVGAFRRNQIDQQLILSDKASPASLAFSGPYYHGTLRGIKTGSMDTVASTPITPVRRQKRASVSGMNLSDLNRSPLEGLSQKRKASAALGGDIHKRHRSISDMEVLQI